MDLPERRPGGIGLIGAMARKRRRVRPESWKRYDDEYRGYLNALRVQERYGYDVEGDGGYQYPPKRPPGYMPPEAEGIPNGPSPFSAGMANMADDVGKVANAATTGVVNPVRDFVNYGVFDRGLTMGFGPEIKAGVMSSVMSRPYAEMLDDYRSASQDWAQKHPGQALAGEAVGLMVPGMAATKAAGSMFRGGKMIAADAAMSGAGVGGIAGYKLAPEGNEIPGAITGAGLGAAGTLAGHGLVSMGSKVLGKIRDARAARAAGDATKSGEVGYDQAIKDYLASIGREFDPASVSRSNGNFGHDARVAAEKGKFDVEQAKLKRRGEDALARLKLEDPNKYREYMMLHPELARRYRMEEAAMREATKPIRSNTPAPPPNMSRIPAPDKEQQIITVRDLIGDLHRSHMADVAAKDARHASYRNRDTKPDFSPSPSGVGQGASSLVDDLMERITRHNRGNIAKPLSEVRQSVVPPARHAPAQPAPARLPPATPAIENTSSVGSALERIAGASSTRSGRVPRATGVEPPARDDLVQGLRKRMASKAGNDINDKIKEVGQSVRKELNGEASAERLAEEVARKDVPPTFREKVNRTLKAALHEGKPVTRGTFAGITHHKFTGRARLDYLDKVIEVARRMPRSQLLKFIQDSRLSIVGGATLAANMGRQRE